MSTCIIKLDPLILIQICLDLHLKDSLKYGITKILVKIIPLMKKELYNQLDKMKVINMMDLNQAFNKS